MGITLSFRPTSAPNKAVADQLKEKCKALGPYDTWWSEQPILMDVNDRGLMGMQKVSLPGYSVTDGGYQEVEQEEDLLMMWHDITRTLSSLTTWARDFGIGWEISLEGEPFGTIDAAGRFSSELSNSLSELLSMSGAPTDEQERASLVSQIARKYASRW
tara:strand:+ start:832 stop:1308 length:477 start_codon:yes stop_codon:yes gene_type:complete